MPFMALDVARLRDSDMTMLTSGDEFKAAVLLWCASWNQVPAASLPNDDRLLAGLARLDMKRWAKVREMALHGYVLCSDGKLYHPVVADKALEAWEDRQQHRLTKASERERKRQEREDRKQLFATLRAAGTVMPWNTSTSDLRQAVTDLSRGQEPDSHRQVTAKTGTGTGTGKGNKKEANASRADAPSIDPETVSYTHLTLPTTPYV